MQQTEFKTKRRNIILSAMISAGVTLILLIFLLISISSDRVPTTLIWAITLVVTILIAILIFDISQLATLKITIDSKSITYSDWLKTRIIDIESINRLSVSKKRTTILDKDGNSISYYHYINEKEKLDNWLQENHQKLEVQPLWSFYRILSFAVNILAVLNFLSTIYFPDYIEAFLAISCLLPVVGFGLVFYSGGKIKFFKKRHALYPSIFLTLLLSILGLFTRTFSRHEGILDVLLLYTYIAFVAFVLFGLYLFAEKKYTGKIGLKASSLCLFVLCIVYGYGFIITINEMLDTSKPTSTEFGIANRYEENESYYLELENNSWISENESNKLKVDKFIYKSLEGKTSIKINTHEGFLGISWFYYDIFD